MKCVAFEKISKMPIDDGKELKPRGAALLPSQGCDCRDADLGLYGEAKWMATGGPAIGAATVRVKGRP